MSERFYVADPLSLGPLVLEGPEAHHLARVCRLRPKDEVCLFNGDGHEYFGEITDILRQSVEIQLQRRASPQRELPFVLEIAAPLPKGDRCQFLIEKLTELGVSTFVPLICQRSVVHPGQGKQDKLQRYVIEASKQCGRNVLMKITPPIRWENYCKQDERGSFRGLAHPGGVERLEDLPHFEKAAKVNLAVGPEGGFTEAEIELGRAEKWHLLNLGPRILRIETAAIALAAQCSHHARRDDLT